MGTIHVPTLLDGILEATAAKAAAEARITSLRAALEDEGRRRLVADGAAPSWNAPRLGKVRLDPAGEWEATVTDEDAFGSYVAEHHPSEATVAVYLKADDVADAVQALEFIGVKPVESRVEVRPAWRSPFLKALAVDVTEERDESAQVTRTVIAADTTTGNVVPGIGVTRSEAKLVVSLDRDRRTAAITEARTSVEALLEEALGEDADGVDLEALHARRQYLETLHADQLANIARGHGLGTSGTKAALAERIARAEQATGHVIRPASAIEPPAPLPEGTEVEEVSTVPLDQPVEEVPGTDDAVKALEDVASREVLRQVAKGRGVSAAGSKRDVALRLVAAGVTPADVTAATEERSA